ncbi:DUF882 domain-containing protein [Xanthobacter agilis]|uniref:Murein endopeptidase K n=1 Tax=Xanthobacter agilis TaxID=47492 RepID=A0ABU0L8P7_XANAG|nr:DUF882 domain-containing protein [Xanthobacter agilis]MDQ0503491.1 uncharacterized protein YcbK (DUF882 family) [Xanthobacter agilis]
MTVFTVFSRPMRRGARVLRASAIGVTLLVMGSTALQNAVANGDTRTLTLHHSHRGETGTFTFKKDGRYDSATLDKLNWFLRDWRNDKPTTMDPQLFDVVWEVYRETDATAPIQIVSAYRSPETNAMLRSRSRGVAKFSQHMLGKAMDFYIPGVKLVDLRVAGLRLQRGGVGFYPTSGSPFVHMDTGNVRHWPRMTRDQLASVFPDGKTVHVPTDGKPMAHYAEALAEIRERGSSAGVAVASADSGRGMKSFFSGFFGKADAEDEETTPDTTVAEASEREAPRAAAPARTAQAVPQATPLPVARPATIAAGALATQQMASAALVAPLPQRRPTDAQNRTRTASASLPAVITRGTDREAPEALGYASAGDVFGPAPIAGRAPAASTVTSARRSRERAPATQAIAFGRLFLSPSLSTELYLRPPELRVFTAFMSAPNEVVAMAFSRDASFGLKSNFIGTAVADVPTFAFRAPTYALNQRM